MSARPLRAAQGGRARQELWELACALGPRRQSQLRLLAVQAQRCPAGPRRWWTYAPDGAPPLVLPALSREASVWG